MKLFRNYLKAELYLFILIAAFTLALAPNSWMGPTAANATPAPKTAMDLVFVIDNSGSMRTNDPKFITAEVVSTFVRQLPADAQVGMVLFDTKARLLTPLTAISNTQQRDQVIKSLKTVDYSGQHTNTPVGIERALYELNINGRQDTQKGIIFITDGIVDTGDPTRDRELTQWLKEDVASKCKTLGIRIFGIALTEGADFSLIQSLASRTNGEYFRTFEASEISGVLRQVQSLMKPEPPKPKLDLAPLPLLPVPDQKSQPTQDTAQKVVEKKTTGHAKAAPSAPATTPAPAPSADKEDSKNKKGTISVTEKSAWMISVALALVIILLIGALVFFFFQTTRRRRKEVPETKKDLNIPKAHLEDMGEILNEEDAPFILAKETITIGRSQNNDLVIDEPAISGFHATIEFRNMSFYLEDQRSTNGTKLNDERLQANQHVRLKDGDRITFATYTFTFSMADKTPFGDPVMMSMTALEDADAVATIVLDLDGADSKQGLISCMQNHLMQIYGLSKEHKKYVNEFFPHDTLDIMATTAHENLQKTAEDNEQHCTPIIKSNAFYVICSLPCGIETAASWYGARDNGFTQFLFKWIRSEQYTSANCEQLCVATFGQDPATWVSITIVPTHSRPNPIEIMSVDFLNEEEKSSMGLDFDNHGQVI